MWYWWVLGVIGWLGLGLIGSSWEFAYAHRDYDWIRYEYIDPGVAKRRWMKDRASAYVCILLGPIVLFSSILGGSFAHGIKWPWEAPDANRVAK